MYEIKQTSFGFRLTLSGTITVDEVRLLTIEIEEILKQLKSPFGIIIDAREMLPVHTEDKSLFHNIEPMTKSAGLQRRAIIFQSPIIKNQATQLSHLSGTDTIERYINASDIENWEQVALDWVVDGIEPTTNQNNSNSVETTS